MPISALDIVDIIRSRGRGDPPSALADVFVNPLTRVLRFLDTKIEFARIEQTLDSIIATLEDPDAIINFSAQLGETTTVITTRLQAAINDIASNFGIVRRPAAPSVGTVLLLRNASLGSPTTPITVTVGRRVFAASINQEYATTETIIINTMVFDVTLNRFIFSLPIQSINSGIDTVASVGQITQIRGTIPGIDGVTNQTAVVGGRDTETDRDLSARIKTALSANNIGTKSGYRLLVLNVPEVKDALVVGASDPLMTRDLGDGGSVDIYVTDPIPAAIAELATNSNTVPSGPNFIFSPSRQPIVPGIIASPILSYDKDESVFAGSIRAKDTITFSIDPTGSTVDYQVNNLISKVQTYTDDPARKILGADVLIKEAITVLIDVIFKIQTLSGFSPSVVKTNVESALTKFVSSLGIGQSLEESDVIRVVTTVPGVDRVNLPFSKFDAASGPSILDPVTGILAAQANEVLRPNVIQANL